MDRHQRDLLVTLAAVMLGLTGVLGWFWFSRGRQGPPMHVGHAAERAAVLPLPASPAPATAPQQTPLRPVAPMPEKPAPFRIHVVGAVRKPGVYALPRDARVDDAVKRAGGATAEADLEQINLADFLKDGEQVRIPRKSDRARVAALPAPDRGRGLSAGSGGGSPRRTRRAATSAPAPLPSKSYRSSERYPGQPAVSTPVSPAGDGGSAPPAPPAAGDKVNLNTATAAELDTLPGVGPATAEAILTYRRQHGPFLRVEDILEVRGIGPKKFESMKDRLTIK